MEKITIRTKSPLERSYYYDRILSHWDDRGLIFSALPHATDMFKNIPSAFRKEAFEYILVKASTANPGMSIDVDIIKIFLPLV